MTDLQNQGCSKSNTSSTSMPTWVLLVDNIPTLVMYFLGMRILWPIGEVWAWAYLAYSLFSIFLFWVRICPYCRHHGTFGCPCGYGIISAMICRARHAEKSDFRTVFRRNILVVFPSWFVPPIVGIWILSRHFSTVMLGTVVAFSLVAFILIPLISKWVGCRHCDIRKDCPWMTRLSSNGERCQGQRGTGDSNDG
jgi:hypothetical protein